jgi:hypothetical protein
MIAFIVRRLWRGAEEPIPARTAGPFRASWHLGDTQSGGRANQIPFAVLRHLYKRLSRFAASPVRRQQAYSTQERLDRPALALWQGSEETDMKPAPRGWLGHAHASDAHGVARRPCGVALLALLALAGCGGLPPAPAVRTATTTPTQAPSSTPTNPPSLVSDCPDITQPAIRPGASLTLRPDSGPVGTQVTVDITGLQPDCQLWLAITVMPIVEETGGIPIAAPPGISGYLRWVAVSTAGDSHATFCVCHLTYAYIPGYPPYPNVTPSPGDGGNHMQYGPQPRDYFYISVTWATIPTPPPLYARFAVTQ